MLFTNYLEGILGSKVRVGIVRALLKFPEKLFTARELANFIKVSHTPVLKSLKDLVGMNLIEIEKHGTSNLIKLNKKSYLYEPLKDLFKYENNTKGILISYLKKIISHAEMVLLFGSIQKNKEKINSDIDLLVVTENKKKVEDSIKEKQSIIIKKFGNPLSVIILTKKQFISKKNKPFAKDLRKNYRVIGGKDLVKKYWK